jgi:aminoglycoside phosphotransferase (APT) family kinase protein
MSAEQLARPRALGARLAGALGDQRWRDLDATLIEGGKSNLTYLLTSAAGELVLRRPPAGEVLATAHDMGREARVQRALSGTAVPVPDVVHQEAADGLLGVPFYVMEKVDGLVIRDRLPDGYADDAASRVALTDALVDALAELHAVDPEAVGLGDYGRPAGFVERQLRRWRAQWDASKFDDLDDLDLLGAALTQLAGRLPVERRSGLVHGDFRLDNCLMDAADPGRVAGVLDWELSTLGDPMTDLGMLLFYWREAGEPLPRLTPALSREPGFPGRDHVAERYAVRAGASLDDLAFYVAFAHFKFAIIAQGIAARVRAEAMAGQDFGDLDDEVRRIVAAGLTALSTRR